jgi:serine/threonine protein kinase
MVDSTDHQRNTLVSFTRLCSSVCRLIYFKPWLKSSMMGKTRDIKLHIFVLTPSAHILLIDFGSAAPLLPPDGDGSRRISKRYCMVPCGTCDYISPEILQAHEEALVALEMSDDGHATKSDGEHGYGLETDWWSLGAMLFEMAYGVAPFFAKDIRQTYLKIMDHKVCTSVDAFDIPLNSLFS